MNVSGVSLLLELRNNAGDQSLLIFRLGSAHEWVYTTVIAQYKVSVICRET
ncbi:MAG: hypothetical protein GY792_37555 [Gammaproteobacteria bacterium]|nr:hypothetical protein [Gammaproteobacteria bacterium]